MIFCPKSTIFSKKNLLIGVELQNLLILFSSENFFMLFSFSCLSNINISLNSFPIVFLFSFLSFITLVFPIGLKKFVKKYIWYIPHLFLSVICNWSSTKWIKILSLILCFFQIHSKHGKDQSRWLQRDTKPQPLTSWPVWLTSWAFVYELSDCGFESPCNHLTSGIALVSSKEFLEIQATIIIFSHEIQATIIIFSQQIFLRQNFFW